jgi:hypothetical protein
MKKYKVIYISGVATGIGWEIEKGYYEKRIESLMPSEEEIEMMPEKGHEEWIKENNKIMEYLCICLNNYNYNKEKGE